MMQAAEGDIWLSRRRHGRPMLAGGWRPMRMGVGVARTPLHGGTTPPLRPVDVNSNSPVVASSILTDNAAPTDVALVRRARCRRGGISEGAASGRGSANRGAA
jgi:hypothetical protein